MVVANRTHAPYILQLTRVDRGHLQKTLDGWDGSLLLSRCLNHHSSSLKKKNLGALCKCIAKKLNSERRPGRSGNSSDGSHNSVEHNKNVCTEEKRQRGHCLDIFL